MGRLAAKVVVVTGGASGIGYGIAERLHAEGAVVVVGDIDSARRPSVERLGAEYIEHDVTNEESWQSLVDAVVGDHNGLNILINNAGIGLGWGTADPETATITDWRRLHAVNVDGVFLGCRTALPIIAQARGGCIVNVASVAAHVPLPYDVAYGASKAAVVHLTRSVALYSARKGYGVRCNSVSPGIVRTPMLERRWAGLTQATGLDKNRVMQDDLRDIPLGHFLEPLDIANAVLFLVSDEARYITGVDLRVDAGIELGL